jgi:hypothetical protein
LNMAASEEHPLSETVTTVFSTFLTKLGEERILGDSALVKLREAFEQQKLDPESLRAAIFGSETKSS